jgi:hypothetical protein
LGVSESWFYKRRHRLPTARQRRREQLADAGLQSAVLMDFDLLV